MESFKGWLGQFQDTVAGLAAAFAEHLPRLVGALALLIVGWLLARVVRAGSVVLARTVSRAVDRALSARRTTDVRLPSQAPKLVGDVMFWIIILFFVTSAARMAQFDVISTWLERVVAYTPTLIAGVVIIVVGYLLSALVRDVVTGAAASAGFSQSELIGTLAQGATFVTGFVIGLDQIGIDVSFLVTIIAIALSAMLAGLSIAFGFGARTFAGNLLSARDVQRHYRLGEIVRLGDIEGEIIDLTPTAVVVSGERGRTAIPAKLFSEQTSVLITPEEADG